MVARMQSKLTTKFQIRVKIVGHTQNPFRYCFFPDASQSSRRRKVTVGTNSDACMHCIQHSAFSILHSAFCIQHSSSHLASYSSHRSNYNTYTLWIRFISYLNVPRWLVLLWQNLTPSGSLFSRKNSINQSINQSSNDLIQIRRRKWYTLLSTQMYNNITNLFDFFYIFFYILMGASPT